MSKTNGFADILSFFFAFYLNHGFCEIDNKITLVNFSFFEELDSLFVWLFVQATLHRVVEEAAGAIKVLVQWPEIVEGGQDLGLGVGLIHEYHL